MSLEAVLKTAIDNLRAAALEREEEVKMAVILPILQALDWNPADPGAFRVEYPAGSGRVDYALLCQGRPSVFIEAKRRGKLDARAEAQLFGYAANNGVPLLVLTDGRRWDFYLSMAEGPPEERRFHRLELRDERMIADYGETLEAWLRKRQVASGEARRSAERRLESDRRRNRARDAMPEAWRALLSEPDGRLCDLLADKVRDRVGIEPQRSDVEEFLHRRTPGPSPPPPPVPEPTKQPGGLVRPELPGETGEDSLQDIVRDLMRIVLEEFPETLDQETIGHLATVKNPLHLKIGNHTLIRRIRDGRKISGRARYWKQPYAGTWYACSQWAKQDHRHNADMLSKWVDSLVEGAGDAGATDRLAAIAKRLSTHGGSSERTSRSGYSREEVLARQLEALFGKDKAAKVLASLEDEHEIDAADDIGADVDLSAATEQGNVLGTDEAVGRGDPLDKVIRDVLEKDRGVFGNDHD